MCTYLSHHRGEAPLRKKTFAECNYFKSIRFEWTNIDENETCSPAIGGITSNKDGTIFLVI